MAKDRFLAVLSHELRNPLASIANATDALQAASRLTPVDRGRARLTLRSQVEAMRVLLDDLLDVSRLRFGRLALKKRDVTLLSVVDSALETWRALFDERRHMLTVSLPGEGIMLDVDPARMSQVLSNLLINAAKYTAEGGRIDLRACVQGDRCRIEVADNGKGCTIVVTPPLGRPAAPTEAGVAPVPARSHVARRRRVVVADDIEDVARALAAALKAWGHDVDTVPDGAGLLALVERERPEVAIVDLGMPGLSGHERSLIDDWNP